MKNKIFFLLLISIQFINAQTKMGILVGGSKFNMHSDSYESSSSMGFQVGSNVRFILDENSEIFAEASFNSSNSNVIGDEYFDELEYETKEFKMKHTSINFGAYYSHYVIPYKLSFFVGPTMYYSIKNEFQNDFSNKDVRFGEYNISSDVIEAIEPSLHLSGGVTLGVNDLKLRF